MSGSDLLLEGSHRPFVHIIALIIPAALGIALSVYLLFTAQKWEESQIMSGVERDAEQLVAAFRRVILHNLSDLDALKAFYDGSEKVERTEFHKFTAHLITHNPSIQALEWIPWVRGAERKSFEKTAHLDGLADFRFTEQSAAGVLVDAETRAEYFPVYYVEPLRGNEAALGYDLASNTTRMEALEKARDTGLAIATPRVKLVQEMERQPGFLIFNPVYENDMLTATVEARRRNLKGFVLGVFRVGDMLEDALKDVPNLGINYHVYDEPAPHDQSFVIGNGPETSGSRGATVSSIGENMSAFIHEALIDVAGRKWLVRSFPTNAYLQSKKSSRPLFILIISLLFTGMVVGYLSLGLVRIRQARIYADDILHSKKDLEREIDERIRTEKILEIERDKAQQYLDVANVIFVALNTEQRAMLINKKGCEILGYKEDDIIGKNWFDNFIPEGNRERVKNIFVQLMAGKVEPVEYFENTVLTSGGEQRMIAWHNTVLKNDSGDVVGTLSSGEDITDKKKLEAQLFQSQKMEAVGRLAGGVAHDFNNILTAIIGYAEMLRLKMDHDDPLYVNVDHILSSSQKAASLTRGLLAFSRKQVIEAMLLDLNGIVLSVEKILLRVIGEDIELKTKLAEQRLPIMADRGQIEQVLMNLAANARDEMPEGGKLTITTEMAEIGEADAKALHIGEPGRFAVLTVSDSGAGMDDATMKKIFEPFFTTKEIGKGTGLGLSMVYGIVEQHRGNINVESELGQGTAFKIFLPLTTVETTEVQPADSESPGGGTETILVAEDDETIRTLTKDVLEDNGYTVVAAFDGEDALEKFRQNISDIHLVLLDVIMPKKNGKLVYDEIKKLRPDIKVLFMSGYDEDLMQKKGIFQDQKNFLLKPIAPEELLLALRRILDE